MTVGELVWMLGDLGTDDAEVFVFDPDSGEFELVTGMVYDHDTVTITAER